MKLKQEDKLPSYRHESPLTLIKNVNALLGPGEYISAREISTAVDKNLIGVPPPRQGTTGRLPEGVVESLFDLFFSHSALCQHNCEKRLHRPEQISILGAIIAPYFKAKNEESMNTRHLYQRIEEYNAFRQDVDFGDPRDLIRFKWFTRENLLLHYNNFEKYIVEKAFARLATPEEILQDGENVKWFANQCNRAGNGDEMSLALGYGSNLIGGRKPVAHSTSYVQNAGQSEQKSSYKITIFMAMTFGDEMMPPLIILPSAADTPRIREDLLRRFPQVLGQYGHDHIKGFDVQIAVSANGSMTTQILHDHFLKLVALYPDLKDEDGFRFLYKLDGGPGRDNPDVLATAKSLGISVYPGCPNTSEGTQEMDQLFHYTKSLMEKNRRLLFEEKQKYEQQVTPLDLPIIIFGGEYTRPNGTTVTFPNAFEISLTRDHLKGARIKTGYCPANRNALRNPKCRRSVNDPELDIDCNGLPRSNDELQQYINKLEDELLIAPEGGEDLSYKKVVSDLLDLNHNSAQSLVDKGFRQASLLTKRLDINDLENPDYIRNSTVTVPGSRERQDLLMKANTAGKFFSYTNGGTAMNCDDALIALIWKDMTKQALIMEKKKKKAKAWENIVTRAEKIIEEGGPTKAPDLRTCIQWKLGEVSKVEGRKAKLVQDWKDLEDKRAPTGTQWTDAREQKLIRLQQGICDRIEDSSLFKRAGARKCTFFDAQRKIVSEKEQWDLIHNGISDFTTEQKELFMTNTVPLLENGEQIETKYFEYDSSSDDNDNANDADSSIHFLSDGSLDGNINGNCSNASSHLSHRSLPEIRSVHDSSDNELLRANDESLSSDDSNGTADSWLFENMAMCSITQSVDWNKMDKIKLIKECQV